MPSLLVQGIVVLVFIVVVKEIAKNTAERFAMPSRRVQRCGGAFFIVLGPLLTTCYWQAARRGDELGGEGSAVFPVAAVMGIALLLFPIDKEELLAKHGVNRPQGFRHYPLSWKVLSVIAIAAGILNFLALEYYSGKVLR
jgi:hypothetical protein